MGCRRTFLLSFLLSAPAGCFGDSNYSTISSMEASKVCLDGGGILDLGSGECICPGEMPWDGSLCEGATPSAPVTIDGVSRDEKMPKEAIPEEHKAMYDSLPKDTKTAESKANNAQVVGPPRMVSVPVAPSKTSDSSSGSSTSVGVAIATGVGSSASAAPSVGEAISTGVSTSAGTAMSKDVGTSKAGPMALETGTSIAGATQISPKTESPKSTVKVPHTSSPSKKIPSPDSNHQTAAAAHDQILGKACMAAKGKWNQGEGVCLCPKGRSLVGRRCQSIKGKLTAVECLAAVHPGVWRKNSCHCPRGQEFSLKHGGCHGISSKKASSPDRPGQTTCENAKNKGRWDGKQQKCKCPSGRIWNKGVCQTPGNLTSRQVCTSDEYGGTWDSGRKDCACPAGSLWLDQRCQSLKSVPDRAACESESNRGRWSTATRTCQCPSPKMWNSQTKSCTNERVSK